MNSRFFNLMIILSASLTTCMQQRPIILCITSPTSIHDTYAQFIYDHFLKQVQPNSLQPILYNIGIALQDKTLTKSFSSSVKRALADLISQKVYNSVFHLLNKPGKSYIAKQDNWYIYANTALSYYDGQLDITISQLVCTPKREYEQTICKIQRMTTPWNNLSFEQLIQRYILVHLNCQQNLPYPQVNSYSAENRQKP